MQTFKFLTQFLLVPLALGAVAMLSGIVNAQTQYQGDNVNSNSTGFQSNEQDPMKNVLGGGLNPMDLMHRAQTGRSRDGSEFAEDTQQNLSKAASDFKKLQQQQLQQSGQLTQGTSSTPGANKTSN